MKDNYLFPSSYKTIGLFIFIPSLITGLVVAIYNFEPSFLDIQVPAIFIDDLFGAEKLAGLTENNFLNELLGILIIASGLLAAFSKEKNEDEFIASLRLKSIVWAVYVNYAVLAFAILFIYDLSFLWVFIINMFTILIFFIIRFNWQLAQLNKMVSNEK